MPQLQAAIVGHNNTRAAVTGQEELLVKVNSIDPGAGLATEATLQVIETNTTGVARTPGFIREVNAAGDLNSVVSTFYSVSVANVGSADGTVLGAVIRPGEILNFSADSLNNFFTSFPYAATGTEFIIIYVS
jgi:hypothetical protein